MCVTQVKNLARKHETFIEIIVAIVYEKKKGHLTPSKPESQDQLQSSALQVPTGNIHCVMSV